MTYLVQRWSSDVFLEMPRVQKGEGGRECGGGGESARERREVRVCGGESGGMSERESDMGERGERRDKRKDGVRKGKEKERDLEFY